MTKVYITALTNERYIPGALALARSLHDTGTKYELAVMIPEDKKECLGSALQEYGVLDVPGTFILTKENIKLDEMDSIVDQRYSYWRETFFKLQATECTEYDKVILLDCDMLVLKNIDHLFDAPDYSAVVCGKCVHPDWLDLNSGLLVLTPSTELHNRLISCIKPTIENRKAAGLQAGDQDVFQYEYPDWRNHPELCLPEKYSVWWNIIDELCEKEKYRPKDFYVIHFLGNKKPWDYDKKYYLKIAKLMIKQDKTKKLLYKVLIWRKYRLLCEKHRITRK